MLVLSTYFTSNAMTIREINLQTGEVTERELTAQEVAALPTPLPAYIAPLTPRQIRMALTRAGLRDPVEVAVSAGSQDLKDWWEWSQAFERLHPEVVSMGDALGQSTEQMDALWTLGAGL